MKPVLFLLLSLLLFSCTDTQRKQATPARRKKIVVRKTPRGVHPPSLKRLLADVAKLEQPAQKKQAVDKYLAGLQGKAVPIVTGSEVTFLYQGKVEQPLAVVGDFNRWNRLADRMQRLAGTDFFYLTLRLSNVAQTGAAYLFCRNADKMRDFFNDPRNPDLSLKSYSGSSYIYPADHRGGRVQLVHPKLPSTAKKVKPKRIEIYLPPSYFKNKQKRYPVLYMHDGQNIWDAKGAPHGGWKVNTTADRLIAAGTIRELIIVGLPHAGRDRIPEYYPPYYVSLHGSSGTGWGDQYYHYLAKDVKPWIDTHYRTRPGRKHTATAGSSCGGIISWYISYTHPETFSTAGLFSPWFILTHKTTDGRQRSLVEDLEKGGKKPVRYYMDCGDSGWMKDGVSGTLKMKQAMLKAGWQEGKDLLFVLDKGAKHNERAWAKRFPRFLRFAFPKHKP